MKYGDARDRNWFEGHKGTINFLVWKRKEAETKIAQTHVLTSLAFYANFKVLLHDVRMRFNLQEILSTFFLIFTLI